MKNILVLMHDDSGQEARFQAALDVTRALDGHLTCLGVAITPVVLDDFAGMGAAAMLAADARTSEAENRARMEARLASEGVAYDWIEAMGYLAPAVGENAAMSDLIVLNRDIRGSFLDMEDVAGDVLLKAGRPILAVPEDCRGFHAHGHAMVAWDGSGEAEAALRAAVPLLARAGTVTLVECEDGSVRIPAERAATYLSRHGIKPVIERFATATDLPSTILLDEVESAGAAYLVMGGFGNSRFLQSLFGGVTRRMLNECPVPLFLAH